MATAIIAIGIGIVVTVIAFLVWVGYAMANERPHKPTYDCGIDDN